MSKIQHYGLQYDPFVRQTTNDELDFEAQPFIETITVQIAKLRIRDTILANVPLLELILGDKGVGKTTAMFFLLKESQKLNNVISLFFTNPPTFNTLAKEIKKVYTFYNPYREEDKEFIAEIAKTRKMFLFIDSQDTISHEELKNFSYLLEFLKFQKNISVFISMNRSHYNRMYKYTEIMGKYNHNRLERFTVEETTQMINKRIQKASIDQMSRQNVFTEGAIKLICEYSKGNPRNTLSMCSQILYQANSLDYPLPLNEEFAKKVLQTDFIIRIVKDRIDDVVIQTNVINLYNLIENHGGIINSYKELYELTKKELGWGTRATLSIINLLISIDTITVTKNPTNMWNKVILTKKGEANFYGRTSRL